MPLGTVSVITIIIYYMLVMTGKELAIDSMLELLIDYHEYVLITY